jgi:cell division transport system ATP-binding protein
MIVFKNVSKLFGSNAPALEDISFQVQKGEFVFLTGHSGSGKTTLLRLLTKEYTPDKGDVEFEGTSLNSLKGSKIHHHRRKIGVVFQDYRLLPELNVWENIALALQISGKSQKEIEERITDLLELVQLTPKAYHFPAELSGGEAQRVGIARALATAPSVLLADEPTGNLDPETTMMIARLFHKIHELGTTILFATHDISVLSSLNHRRIHLDKGRMVSDTGTAPGTATTGSSSSAGGVSPAAASSVLPQPVSHVPTPPISNPTLSSAPQPSNEVTHPIHMNVNNTPKSTTSETNPTQPLVIPHPPKKKGLFGLPGITLPFGKKSTSSKNKPAPADKPSKPLDPLEQQMSDMLVEVESLDGNEKKKSSPDKAGDNKPGAPEADTQVQVTTEALDTPNKKTGV